VKKLALVSTVAVIACACSSSARDSNVRAPAPAGIVLYTRGASTDPYGSAHPNGFGVVIAPSTTRQRVVQVIDDRLGWSTGAEWLGPRRIVVPRKAPWLGAPLVYEFTRGVLRRIGPAPVPRREVAPVWSPDRKLIAAEPIEPCSKRQRSFWTCYRASARVVVRDADGSDPRIVARAHLDSWTPRGRLLITNRAATAGYEALDVETRRRSRPLSPGRVAQFARVHNPVLGPPRWSADMRYIGATVDGKWPKGARTLNAIILARADGTPLRLLCLPYAISMFAWAPVGHRLAYTTSGFPSPHELLVVDPAEAGRKRIYATADHFDWITWSPDGERLLLDEGVLNRWSIFSMASQGRRTLRRFGGRPLWCCPVNRYATHY
jgi:hypothetical protein